MSNAEDLNRLTACSLVLLGHIFYVLGNHRESNNMVVPAMQLASKIPDMLVQLWSSALLRGEYSSQPFPAIRAAGQSLRLEHARPEQSLRECHGRPRSCPDAPELLAAAAPGPHRGLQPP
ncbi:MAU2 chromatid cohesion factor homolog [Manis pentadactyla]|uniref:MAU2 chromatid cohesion factor homolog n=1 Tax=Manis pentadactyla TaxID=143292 RepID=UPI00255CBA3C|nr:MAU2 chromatid cohesion factor homolog [Manis pentadactyla]